jgi:hypothetical protein
VSDHPVVSFCPACFADEKSGSWDHVVVGQYCTNCGNGSTIIIPEWAVAEIRRNASWVGKRFYPADEDRERLEERADLLSVVPEFPGRDAKQGEERWSVWQLLPNGSSVITSVKADSKEAAMRASGLRYVPASKLP